MAPARRTGSPHGDPIDTTGDPVLEAKWQALVDEVIEAKAAAGEARSALVEAEVARGDVRTATPASLALVDKARAAYRAAAKRVEKAAKALKAGDL